MKDTTSLYQYVINTCFIKRDAITTCVHLPLPASVDEYQKMLSKKMRQNLRTAYNHLQKGGHFITFDFNDKPDLNLCEEMRDLRLGRKKNEEKLSLWRRLKRGFKEMLTMKFPAYLPFYEDKQSCFLTAYIDDEFCAFFNYGMDKEHGEIVVIAAGINEKYAKYSPGVLLLYEYIRNQIIARKIQTVDLTRGDEKYKYSLGGSEHYIHTVRFES